MLNHSSQIEENILSQRQRRSSKKNSRNMKAYEKKRFENGSQEIKQFMIIDSVSPPTRSFQDPLASCFTDSPLKTSDLASNLLNSNFNFSHHTPNKHDYLIKETLPTNDKDRLLRDILVRLNTYKRHWSNVRGISGSSDFKLQLNNPFYYDYLNEKDDFTLKVLIQILYEEIENLSDFFEQNSLSQKEDYDKMEQRLREKDALCTSIVKETLEQKSAIAQYRAKIEESDKKSSGYINCISDLQRALQNIFEDIFSSKFELGGEKKLEIGNLIKNTLNNIPYFIQESTIDRTRRESSDQRKSEHGQQHFSPITSVKRELTYSDLMDVMNKDLNTSPPAAEQIKSSPKADLKQLLFDNRYSSPRSNGRQDEDDFESKKHRRSFSFNKNSFAAPNASPNRGNQRISEELASLNNQLIQKAKDLEESLTQANKTIASLIEEKNSLEPIVKQLRIQKDELAIKLQAFDMRPTNNTNLEERLATFMSEGPTLHDELSKSLNFPETQSMRDDLKAVLKVMKEAEEKIVSFHERTSYQTNFSYDNERPNSLKRINTGSLSKIREGSDFSEEGKGFFDHHHLVGVDALEMLQTKLKNSQEIHKILIKQYENKVLDTIEKLEDMKGMCNLVLTTNQNMVRANEDHTPTRIRALHTELERKNVTIQEKIKRIEQNQEINRLELEELIRQEEFVEEFYKSDQRPNDGKPHIKNESLVAENHELNEMVQILSQEITSLKSQLKLQTAVLDHSPLLEPLSSRSTRRLSRDSSYQTTLNEKQRVNYNNLINQSDFYYMLNTQATSLEALLS